MMHNKLNLGCGKFSKSGWINLDLSAETDADIIHNLENFPWPLPDNYFALVEITFYTSKEHNSSWDSENFLFERLHRS